MTSLLVMLPALNEEATVASVIAKIPKAIDGISKIDVLVVDDGSTDKTVELARGAGASVVSHGHNRGVGAAMQTALGEAIRRRADIAVNMDSDGQFDPTHIPKLIAPILARQAEMATASRFLDPALAPVMPLTKRLGNYGMARLVSFLAGGKYADVSCGFRAYSREALLRLVLTGAFTYTQESFLVLANKGLRIVEVPLAVRGVREHGESRVASNLFRYAARTSAIIFACVRDYKPSSVFGTAAFALFFLSFCAGAFFVGHYIVAGQFSPHIWAGFVSAFLFGLGMLIFALGQIALMVARLRVVQDQQLYILRKLESSIPELKLESKNEVDATDPDELLREMQAALSPDDAAEMAIPSYLHRRLPMRTMAWWRVEILAKRLARAARGRRDLTIVDYGCGAGVLFDEASRVGGRIVGVDIVLTAAKILVERRHLTKVELVTPDEASERVADKSVDVILAGEVLEHVEPLGPVIETFARWLRPSGKLLVTLPTESALYRLGRKLAGFSGHYHHDNASSIDGAIRGAGFERSFVKKIPAGGPLAIYWCADYAPR